MFIINCKNYNEISGEKINPLLVWYYKLRKKKVCNNICDICSNEFRFYKGIFDKTPSICFECDPDQLHFQ